MPRLVPRRLCVVAFAVSALSSTAHAKPFDLIYADRVDVTTAFTNGFSYGNDIGLIVNTGTSDITASDLSGVTFTTSSSNPAVLAQVSHLNEGFAAPILPYEAVGTLLPGSVLPALVLPGETLQAGQWISAGRDTLAMQGDGNLVLGVRATSRAGTAARARPGPSGRPARTTGRC